MLVSAIGYSVVMPYIVHGIALDLGKFGITVNAYAPGSTNIRTLYALSDSVFRCGGYRNE